MRPNAGGATTIAPRAAGRRVRVMAAAVALSLAIATPVGAVAGSAAEKPAPRASAEWGPPAIDLAIEVLSSGGRAAATREPRRGTVRLQLRPPPRRGPFSMNLYQPGDFVHQQTRFWCIAAASQTMINIIQDGQPDRSRALQRRLHFQARRLDQRFDEFWASVAGKDRWDRGLHGLGIRDWAGILDARGHGHYEIDRARTRKQAIRKAARAIRLTGRPAGLVVWRGAHAWVMSGFRATADPAYTADFRVRSVFVSDPWYPSVSSIWGPSRPPDSEISVRALDEDYLPYDRPGRRHPMRDGRYMLVLPVPPTDAPVATGRRDEGAG